MADSDLTSANGKAATARYRVFDLITGETVRGGLSRKEADEVCAEYDEYMCDDLAGAIELEDKQ